MGEDGQYHAIELRAPIGLLQVAPPQNRKYPRLPRHLRRMFSGHALPEIRGPSQRLDPGRTGPRSGHPAWAEHRLGGEL